MWVRMELLNLSHKMARICRALLLGVELRLLSPAAK